VLFGTVRARVPADPRTVTTIRHETEMSPRSLGLDSVLVESIWDAVERLYASGIHPAIQVCVRYRGAVILDRAIGWAQGGGPDDPAGAAKRPCTPDTPFVLFSASKAVTAMLVHLLDERNLIKCRGGHDERQAHRLPRGLLAVGGDAPHRGRVPARARPLAAWCGGAGRTAARGAPELTTDAGSRSQRPIAASARCALFVRTTPGAPRSTSPPRA
jgi:hypothetical protein